MLGNLLINTKNGRGVKTYGVIQLKTNNMKIIFLYITTILSISVYASEDIEIYPGLNFAVSPEHHQGRSTKSQDLLYTTFLKPKWQQPLPFSSLPISEYNQIRKKDQDFIYSLPDRLREFQEIVNSRRNQFKRERDKTPYFNFNRNDRIPQPEEIYEAYKSLQNANGQFDRYQLRYPNQQILDDVRPYPHDDDFSFRDDDVEDDEVNDSEISIDRTTEEASGKGEIEHGKSADDQSLFAYPPSDPRYFENTPYNEPKTRQQIKTDYIESNGNNEFIDDADNKEDKIFVKPRNDEVYSNQHMKSHGDADHHNDNTVEVIAVRPHFQEKDTAGVYIIAVVAGISAAATVGLIAFGIGWYNLQKHVKNASDVEYPAYGVTGPNKDVSPSGDRRLAQSAQMYHYQHQKQQIIAMESRATATDRHGSLSEADSDEENEEGDYTVYECPGLAPTGEMEVKNPLFQDDPTPAQTPPVKTNGENVQKK